MNLRVNFVAPDEFIDALEASDVVLDAIFGRSGKTKASIKEEDANHCSFMQASPSKVNRETPSRSL